jgi:TolB protein
MRRLLGGLLVGGLLALLLLLAGPASRAPASFPGKNGRLAIQSDRGTEGNQIFTVNPGGGGIQQLTHTSNYVTLPAFSRSGDRIAFTEIVDDGSQRAGDIFVMRSDGSHQRNLTKDPSSDYSPSFSPDSKKILFESDGTGNDQIYLMNADGTHQHRIIRSSHDDDDPVFFPSGRKIAFTRYAGGSSEIFTARLDGTHQRQLTDNSRLDYYPDVSPNGKLIAFNEDVSDQNPELFVMQSDGSHKQRLTHSSQRREFDATFSPNSRQIAFDSAPTGQSGDYDVFAMRADGTHVHTVLDGPSSDYVADWARK